MESQEKIAKEKASVGSMPYRVAAKYNGYAKRREAVLNKRILGTNQIGKTLIFKSFFIRLFRVSVVLL